MSDEMTLHPDRFLRQMRGAIQHLVAGGVSRATIDARMREAFTSAFAEIEAAASNPALARAATRAIRDAMTAEEVTRWLGEAVEDQ